MNMSALLKEQKSLIAAGVFPFKRSSFLFERAGIGPSVDAMVKARTSD